MKRELVVVKKEPPSLFCGKHRGWVETQEQHNMFSEVDGSHRPVRVWICPPCLGVGGEVAEGAAAPVTVPVEPRRLTAADIVTDERLGPYRAVRIDTIKLNASGATARADLECGHNVCIVPKATKARCRKCGKAMKEAK